MAGGPESAGTRVRSDGVAHNGHVAVVAPEEQGD